MTSAEVDRRMAALAGDVLDLAPDPVLQAVAAEAVEATDATWSAIQLQLRHTVIYRAHFNLPRELANLYSTERSATCCEEVVQTGITTVVEDAECCPEQREITLRTGVRAYLG